MSYETEVEEMLEDADLEDLGDCEVSQVRDKKDD